MNLSGLFEVLSILLEWTSDTHLQKTPTFQDSPQGSLQEQHLDFPSALVHEKCSKVCLFDGKGGFHGDHLFNATCKILIFFSLSSSCLLENIISVL